MRRIRQFAPALLLAVFWLAQVQGTVHAISHLGAAAGISDRATIPHSVLCIECAAFAQAGAGPVAAAPAVPVSVPTAVLVAAPSIPLIAADSVAAYRSRAPPFAPI